MSDIYNAYNNKKEQLNKIIKRLHQGENVKKLKEEFKDLLDKVAPRRNTQIM